MWFLILKWVLFLAGVIGIAIVVSLKVHSKQRANYLKSVFENGESRLRPLKMKRKKF